MNDCESLTISSIINLLSVQVFSNNDIFAYFFNVLVLFYLPYDWFLYCYFWIYFLILITFFFIINGWLKKFLFNSYFYEFIFLSLNLE